MILTEIKRTQRKVGAEPDGFWGAKSAAACRAYLRKMMPDPHPFPTKANITKFYGQHGSDSFTPPVKAIRLPFPVYYEGKEVLTLKPHVKCADAFLRAFERLAKVYPSKDARDEAGILTYDGLYNPRKMRGGSSWSMHAWAIAIDFNAEHNGNTMHWPTAAVMPIEVMECFALEGIAAAGAFWSRDAMHMEAVNPD